MHSALIFLFLDVTGYNHGYYCSETGTEGSYDVAAEPVHTADPNTTHPYQSCLTSGQTKESGNTDSNSSLQPQTGDQGSIADVLRATAEEALCHTGFVFDENSGMYYDHSTGFFYDSTNCLYYDANTGIYYYYDADSGKYQFHSRVELSGTQTTTQEQETYEQATVDKASRDHKDGDRTEGLTSSCRDPDTSGTKSKRKKKCVRSTSCRKSSSKKDVRKAKKHKSGHHSEDDKHLDCTRNPKKKKRHKKTVKAKRKKDGRREKKKRRTRRQSTDSEIEEGEITDLDSVKSSSSSSSSSTSSSSSSSSSEKPNSPNTEEVAPEAWPPCVRVTVVRSPALQIGSLFILTADTTATIGREKDMDHAIRIPEVEVSKSHAMVYFDLDQQCYMLTDLGSQNGTVINGNRILQPKVQCEPCPLSHGDEVKIGETVLSFHIHSGNDTCDGCEPGQIFAHLSKHPKEKNLGHAVGEDKELQRQRELKQMKVKYGLKNSDFESNKAVGNPMYKDRANTRRQVVGSEGTFYRDDSPSSVHVEISEVNKGRTMLEKMGWKKGEGLGKDGAGMKDPIQVQVRQAQSGLGSCKSMDMDQASWSTSKTNKAEKWKKAQERFIETCQAHPSDG